MMHRRAFLITGTATAALVASGPAFAEDFPFTLTDAEWRDRLTADQYAVLRENATEPAGSSPLHLEMREGIYHCAGCDEAIYDSKTKFFSDSGWPAFYEAISTGISEGPDPKYGELLTEVHCSNCGSHHGHIFNDGPEPTGERHCINGVGMVFKPTEA